MSNKKIISTLDNAFDEIHIHTFVRYYYEITKNKDPKDPDIIIARIDNIEEIRTIFERMSIEKKDMA